MGWGGGAFNFVSPGNSLIQSGSRTWNDSTFGAGDPRSGGVFSGRVVSLELFGLELQLVEVGT